MSIKPLRYVQICLAQGLRLNPKQTNETASHGLIVIKCYNADYLNTEHHVVIFNSLYPHWAHPLFKCHVFLDLLLWVQAV